MSPYGGAASPFGPYTAEGTMAAPQAAQAPLPAAGTSAAPPPAAATAPAPGASMPVDLLPSPAATGSEASGYAAPAEATSSQSVLPPYPTFPASDPGSIGLIDAYASAIATSLTQCGLRDQNYLDIINRAVQSSLQQAPAGQSAVFQRLHGNGSDISHFGLPSCADYVKHAEYSSMIVSMDNFVHVSGGAAGASEAD